MTDQPEVVTWGVERPMSEEVRTRSQMIDVIHDMLTRYEESLPEYGYVMAPGPVMAIAYVTPSGKRVARIEGPVIEADPGDDVVPL